jgi:hypothetical protein
MTTDRIEINPAVTAIRGTRIPAKLILRVLSEGARPPHVIGQRLAGFGFGRLEEGELAGHG